MELGCWIIRWPCHPGGFFHAPQFLPVRREVLYLTESGRKVAEVAQLRLRLAFPFALGSLAAPPAADRCHHRASTPQLAPPTASSESRRRASVELVEVFSRDASGVRCLDTGPAGAE